MLARTLCRRGGPLLGLHLDARPAVVALRFCAWLVCMGPWLLPGSRVAAQALPEGGTVAIIPGGDLVDHALEGEVRASLTAGLTQLGQRVVPPHAVRTRLQQVGKPALCASLSGCDYQALINALGAETVVVYSLWLHDEVPSEFAVGITRRGGTRGDASHRIRSGETLARVVPDVLMQALKVATGTGTVSVRVETDPPGAKIEIDRRLLGTSPAHFDLTPGQHEVRATADGRVALLDYIEVEPADGEQLVALVLAEAEAQVIDDGPVELTYEPPSHTLDYVLGSVVGAVAVGAIIYGVLSFNDEGNKCYRWEEGPMQRCIEAASPPPLTLVALGAGGVLATGSVLLFTLTPFTNGAGDVAGLELHGRF